MRVYPLNPLLYRAYDDFCNSYPNSMLYYSLPFKRLLKDFLKCDSLYSVAMEGDKIIGVLPLMKRKGKYGEVLNSLPFYGSNGGVLAFNQEAKACLCEYYNHLTQEFAASTYITHPFDDVQDDKIIHDMIDERIGQWTPLCDDQTLWLSFEPSARRNVMKAKREGVEVNVAYEMDFLYETHRENISSIGGIAKQKEFFDSIQQCCEWDKDYQIYVAYYNKKPIAALLLFFYGNIIEYYTPATLHEYRTLQALPLLVHTAMQEGFKKGYQWWNWGGSWKSQDGVYRFKKKFGGLEKPYFYFVKINHQAILSSSKEELSREYPYFYVLPFNQLKGE